MGKWWAALLLALFMVPVSVARGGGDLSEFREAAGKIKSLKADFIQEKHLKILNKPLVSRGRLFYRPPNYLRWEYTEPIKSVMLMRQDLVRMLLWRGGAWAEDAGQSVEVRRVVLDEISGWFGGRFDQAQGFEPRYEPGTPPRIVLTPKPGLRDFIERVELLLSEQPGVITSVEIVEGPDASTVIEFTKVQVDMVLSDDIFEKP
jgi:outer membrane lipoprotein-sorting protein